MPISRPTRRRALIIGSLVGATALAGAALWAKQAASPQDLADVATRITRQFPDVRHVDTTAVVALLAKNDGNGVQIIDAREPKEFAVSHIAGAVNVPPGSSDDVLRASVDPQRPVLVYCSIGYRSAVMAERFKSAGARDVANYAGSIFAWANAGHPLVTADGKPTQNVHPYDATWGKHLRPELRRE